MRSDPIGMVSAIIVTRGDVDLTPCLCTIDADEIVIRRGHGGVWERFDAAMTARHDVIYVQDDDAVVPFAVIVTAYERGFVTCNMPVGRRPEYQDGIALVGWGAVFHRSALCAFATYRAKFPVDDELFRREADRVFTALNRCKLIDVPFERLPWEKAANRLAEQPEHGARLAEIRQRIGVVKAGSRC